MSETKVLDAAEELFYDRGIHAVGMDDIRTTSGVSLKRLYQLFPSKEALVVGYLERRDRRWRGSLAEYVAGHEGDRVALVFDWLHDWFSEPGFRGCAFLNSFGEMGTTSPAIMAIVRHHKVALRAYVISLCPDVALAEQILLLIDGAITIAAITGDPSAAHRARAAAAVLISG
jgi:AcrR family transcriptional regulator